MWTAQRHGFCRSAPDARKGRRLCKASPSVQPASTTLSPRQRKLAAKRKQKQQQRLKQDKQQLEHSSSSSSSKHAKQRQQQQQHHSQVILPPSLKLQQHGLPASILSLNSLIHRQQQQQQQQQHILSNEQVDQHLQSLSPGQLSQVALLWAQDSRNMSFSDLEAAKTLLHCYVTAAQQQLQQAAFDRQQLANVAWGLAHFDGLEWRCQQQQQSQLLQSCPSGTQQQQQQQQQQFDQIPLHWCGAFQSALRVPFLVLPNIMPDLQITDFLAEITLQRDVIYLTDDSGQARAVPEARLTGWQSDIGATFKYSGKEMTPAATGLTPCVAQVRDVLTAVGGVHYDSVLINYYADGKCGMRYHVDPLYSKWTPNTAVVSLGDTRQFVFRRIDDHSVRWAYKVSNGDVVIMFDDCQDVLQHAIKVEAAADAVGPRVSLVYKQRIKLEDGNWS